MTDSCDAIWDLLSLYADGMAGVDDSAAVERHIAACDSCSRDLAFMRSTSTLIAATPAVEPPSSLHNAIMAATVARRSCLDRARDTFRVPAYRFTGLSLAGAAAAAVAVAVLMPSNPKLSTVPASHQEIASHPPESSNILPPDNSTVNAIAERKQPNARVANRQTGVEHTVRPSSAHIERAIALQPAERIERPLFSSDMVNHRKPPAPGAQRVIAKLPRPKNDPKSSPSGAPMDVNPPLEPLTSPAPPMTMPDGMAKAPNVVDPGVPPIKTVPSSGKITLAASNTMSATGAASLAGLRGSLQNQRKDSERSISSAVYRPNETNQVTLDLIKSKF